MEIIILLISFFASLIGAICGIGGGVIIKPVIDACTDFPAATVNFLSGCTVLTMTTYSVIRAKAAGKTLASKGTGLYLAVGAAVGGILGKILFDALKNSGAAGSSGQIKAIQAAALFFITFGTLVYTLNKTKVRTIHVENPLLSAIIGLSLGIMSSFLGIGGGPINLVVLHYFFSMGTKEAAGNSLYIIFMSQLLNLAYTLISGGIPDVSLLLLLGMMLCGILGGIFGRWFNKKIADHTVNKLFIGLIVVIMMICVYNYFSVKLS